MRRLSGLGLVLALVLTAPIDAGAGPALSNDECASAVTVAALPFDDLRAVASATTNASDPMSACESSPDTPSVWYRFTPSSDVTVAASLFGTNYDTILTVFVGACGALSEITCDDDVGGSLQSRVVFDASAGQTYFFMITSFGADDIGPSAFLQIQVDETSIGKQAKAVVNCQKTMKKTVRGFLGKALGTVDKCIDPLFKCTQLEPGDPACVEDACEKCLGVLEKGAAQILKLREGVLKKCGPDVVPFARLLSTPGGLGYDELNGMCTAISEPLVDVPTVLDCIGERGGCANASLVAAHSPRAREMFGLCGALPEDELGCLPDYGTGGAVQADQAKAVTKCSAGAAKAATKLAVATFSAMEKCADRVFACLHNKPPGDECADAAIPKCEKDMAKIDSARTKFVGDVVKKCGNIPFSVLESADGLNLDALQPMLAPRGALSCGSLSSVQAWAQCLASNTACTVQEAFVRMAVPTLSWLFQAGKVDLVCNPA